MHVGCQCLCDRTGLKPRMSTDAPPSYHAHIMFIAERKCLYVERSRSMHVWTNSVSDSCVRHTSNVWNTAPYLLLCDDVLNISIIC